MSTRSISQTDAIPVVSNTDPDIFSDAELSSTKERTTQTILSLLQQMQRPFHSTLPSFPPGSEDLTSSSQEPTQPRIRLIFCRRFNPTDMDTETPTSESEELLKDFLKGATADLFNGIPPKTKFIESILKQWASRNHNPIILQCCTTCKYYFKIQENPQDGLSLSVLKVDGHSTRNLYTDLEFSDIQDVIAILSPLFDKEYDLDSDTEFSEQLQGILKTNPSEHFQTGSLSISSSLDDEPALKNSPPLSPSMPLLSPSSPPLFSLDVDETCNFIRNSDVANGFATFPSSKQFEDELRHMWHNKDEECNGISLYFSVDETAKYFFNLKRNDHNLLDFSILKMTDVDNHTVPCSSHTQFKTIEDAILFLAPLFDGNYESAEVFDAALYQTICNLMMENFIDDAYSYKFEKFPKKQDFDHTLKHVWKKKPSDCDRVTLSFEKDSTSYGFRFESMESGIIEFDLLRVRKENTLFQIDSQYEDFLEFTDIEEARRSLKSLFDKEYESDEAFYTQSLKPYLDEVDINHLEKHLESQDPNVLQDAWNTLVKLETKTVLKIGDKEFLMSMSALMLYYLHIIQRHETPHLLKDDPNYAAHAFQNIEECVSTPDQRLRAYHYARVDQLFNQLEMALKNANNKQAQKFISDLNDLGKNMPDSVREQLTTFTVDLHQELGTNLEAIERTRQAMKHRLNLP